MPRGTRHTLTGMLRLTSRGYLLDVDDGGTWRLDIDGDWNPAAKIGCRVTVEGKRADFDLLDVYRLYIA